MEEFIAGGKRRRLHALVITDMAAAVFMWTSAGAGGSYGWIFQLVGVALAGVGVYLLTRYSLRKYSFSVQDSGLVDASGRQVYDLVVTQTLGRRITVVARISVRDIRRIEVLSRADFRGKRRTDFTGLTLFRYESDPFSPSSAYITVPDENALLAIPPIPALLELLRRMGCGENDGKASR